ncbi:DoxX family protein [Larkinella soli]|uniref:DoxX family protein n=1 Tax=Larkinella soli TaxID=1770527 RepID=UPI0013E3C71B|nr:DoxX family protein [Larkinella soli]
MNSAKKSRLRRTPSVVLALLIAIGACLKLSGIPEMVDHYSDLGLVHLLPVFALLEIGFVTLYLIPRTMKLGFLLLTGYFGGAIATELSHGNPFAAPLIILALVWAATWFRNPAVFTPNPEPTTV